MAKKVSTNKITNLSQDWGLDTSNGLPYSGQSVQDFIKEGLATANTAYSERWGAVYFDSATYTLLGFKNEDDKETYLAGGDSSLVIGREIFNFSGTINQIKIINKMNSNTVYFTNTAETANLTVGFISQQKGITDQDWTEILEDFYVTISVDKGSTGEFVNIETNKLVLNGFDYTFDVKKYVAFGGNRVRVTATGVTTNTTTNFIFNVHLTSMYLSPSNFAWNKPFVEGEAYNLGGMNIGGNINKLLKVKVTNDGLGYSRVFEENLKTATYITNSYFYKGLVFPETGTGVYHVEIWLDADGLESDHLHYNIMCIASADKATASLININEVFEADNGTDADLFKYSIYNAGMASGNPYFKISKDGEVAREETLEGVPTASVQTYSAALEFESEEAMFDILVDASIGDYHQQATVTIDNTTSFPAVADTTFYMNAATRSNNQTNRDKIINEISGEEISTTFSNIAWVDGTDGWTVDKGGRKCLLLPARSKMTVNIQPLALIGQGKTIEMAFKVENAADYNEPIVSIADATDTDFRGVVIKPKNVCVHSRDLHTNDLAQSYNLKDDELVHLIITIVKNYKTNYGNLAQIYVNGVKTTSFSFTNTDDFTSKASLVLGSNTADLYVYKMRVYENGFGWQDSIQNYINCLPGVVEKVAAWDKISSVIDDSYNLDYDAVFGKYNTMVIEMLDGKPLPDKLNPSGDNPPLCNLEINIVDPIEGELDEDFAQFFNGTPILNQTIEGQGTTAMTYYRWNFRWKMDKKYNKRRITAKKNVASSMHSHKMGATRLYNDLHNAVVGFNDANARVAVFQYPVYGFLKTLVEGTTDQYVYTGIGLYTIGPDKGDKVTFGYDQSEFKNSIMHLEGTDHTPMSVGFDYPWAETQYLGSKEAMGAITKDGSIAAAWEVGAAGDYDPKDNPTEVKAMLDVEFKPAYEVVYNNSTCILGVTETLAEINADPVAWRKRVADNGKSYSELEFWTDGIYDLYYYNVQQETFKSNGINLLTQLNIDASELIGLDIDAKNELFKTRRRENFIANWENYWDKDDAIFHDVILEIIAASDNFKKNNYPYKFKSLAEGGRWCRRQDDLDSIFDVNNQGFAAKLYSVLMGDKTATGSGSVFRGENSIFHTLVHECFKEEKKQMAHRIFDAMAELSPYGSSQIDRLVGYIQNLFWDKAQDYFTKSAYNIDAEWTYEEAWPLRTQGIYVNDVDPLQQSLGSHIEAERNWVELRMVFMASYYNWGPFATDNGDDASTGQVSFRAAGGKTYTITPALDLNPTILIGQSDLATYGDRVLAGTPVEVTVPDMGNNDTHVYIQGTDYVADLGDLSDLQVSADNPVLTVASKRLRKLKTGDEIAENVTSNVADMGIGYCPSLEEIDSRNLASLTGTVDLTQCPRLRKALFEGTNAANLQIAAGSKIEELSLPDTVTTLSLIRLPNLTEDNLKYNSLNALSYLRLEDNDSINNFEMLKNAYTNSPALKNIRVVGFEYDADANDIAMIARFATDKDENGNPVYQGIDDNGDPTLGLPVLDGTFTLDGYLYESDYNTVKANYPKLNIEAAGFYMDFEDPEVVRILLANMTTDDNIGITREQAEGVTSINGWFHSNAVIKSFNELEHFTGLTQISPKNDGGHGSSVFWNATSLEEVTIPKNVTRIGSYAFTNCNSLSKITFADKNKITEINAGAFDSCSLLDIEIDFPNLIELGESAFNRCANIRKITNLGKITKIKGVGNIGQNWGDFYRCTSLEDVTLPNTLESIGMMSFYGCSSMTRCVFPTSLTTIGAQAFYNCTSLAFEHLNLPNLTTLGQDAFYGVKIKKLSLGAVTSLPSASSSTQNYGDKSVLEEVVLSDALSVIPDYSFRDYIELSSLKLPSNLTEIGTQAFSGCTSFNIDVSTLPKTISNIESLAFQGVKTSGVLDLPNLTGTITWGNYNNTDTKLLDGVENLGAVTSVAGFMRQAKLKFAKVPSTCTKLETDAFSNCTSLEYLLVWNPNPPTLGTSALNNTNNCPIYVPGASLTAYREATNWINYASRIFPLEDYMDGGIITFADPVVEALCVANWDTNNSGYMSKGEVERITDIGTVFKGNTEITSFGEFEKFTGLTSVPDGAFSGCTNLMELTIPKTLTVIKRSAFANVPAPMILDCPNLTDIWSDSAYTGAFYNSGLTEIRNLGTITKLQNGYNDNNKYGIFADCKNLTKVVLPETLINVESVTFIGCTSLTDINLDHVVTFGRYAFSNCTSLSLNDLTLTNAQTIHPGAFANVPLTGKLSCPSLTSLPGERYSMGAFENTNLTEIADLGSITTIPDFRESAATGCFANNQNLIKVTLPETLTFIGRRAFRNCPKLTTCNIPSSVTTINDSAFANNENLLFEELNLPNLTTLGQNAFYGVKIKKISLDSLINLPSGTTNGWTENYGNQTILEEVVLSNLITTISSCTFFGYSALTKCDIPKSVTKIDGHAFEGTKIEGILDLPNLTTMGTRAFSGTNISKVVNLGTITSLPEGEWVSAKRQGVFALCANLTSVVLPETLTNIGYGSFAHCTALQSLNIPESVTFIGEGAFENCSAPLVLNTPNLQTLSGAAFNGSGLVEIKSIGKITTIESGTSSPFYNCTKLKKVTWSTDTVAIQAWQFRLCESLDTVIIPTETVVTLMNSDAFSETSADLAIYVLDELVDAYKTAENWSVHADKIKPLSEYVE